MQSHDRPEHRLLVLTNLALDAARSGGMEELCRLLTLREHVLAELESMDLSAATLAAISEAQKLTAKLEMLVGAQMQIARGELEAASRDRSGIRGYAVQGPSGRIHESRH